MKMLQEIWRRVRTEQAALLGILVLAASLRWVYIGAYQFVRDEVPMHFVTMMLGRYGQWTWGSNASHSTIIPIHSPFSTYLAAIPYLFSGDPRLGRLWVGVFGISAVGILYYALRRYFGVGTGVIGGLLLATHTLAVDWSRTVWNPNYAQPFIAAWILTGLLGYYERRPRMIALHWLMLSFVIQPHFAYASIGVLSLLLLAIAWRGAPSERPMILRATLFGWGLFAVSLIPWLIGLAQIYATRDPAATNLAADLAVGSNVGFQEMVNVFGALSASVGRQYFPSIAMGAGPLTAYLGAGHWWPPAWTSYIFGAQALLSLLAVALMFVKSWREKNRMPLLFLGLLGSWPMAAFFVAPVKVYAFYIMPLMFGAVASLAIFLADVAQWHKLLRWAVALTVIVFAGMQAWLTVATIRDQHLAGNLKSFNAPLDTFLSAIRTWREAGGNRELIFLTETQEGKYDTRVQTQFWRIFAEGYPSRAIIMNPYQGVPIPPNGAILVSTYGGVAIPDLFGEGYLMGELVDGDPMFRWLVLEGPPSFPIDLYPRNFSRFASGARILGVSLDQPLQPGVTVPIKLLWRIDKANPTRLYSFSVRLVDDQGQVFGQVDGLSLSSEHWRENDTVVNRLLLPVSENYPAGQTPRLNVLMYSPESVETVVDDRETVVATEVALTTTGATDHLGWFQYNPYGVRLPLTSHRYFARFNEQIDLLGFSVPSTAARPGEDVPVTLYWAAAQTPTVNYHVFVHLRDENGNLVGQADKANPAGAPATHWTTTHYLADDHQLTIAPDTPPGRYQLFVGLWEESLGRANAYDESGNLLGDSVPLGIFVEVQP